MNPFDYERATSVAGAVEALVADPHAHILAGGTNLVDLMKAGVERPRRLIDITRLPALGTIDELPDGGLRVGALVLNSDLAADRRVRERYPLLAEALLAAASPQLRNRATTAGNMLQRTRCSWFYDPSTPCNKRQPGSGCSAIGGGYNRYHAVLGWSEHCIAVNASDMAVALAALDATVVAVGPGGERRIPFVEFHTLPGDHPERDHVLERGEVITAVELPAAAAGRRARYVKVRDRASYAFAVVSVAAELELDGDPAAGGTVRRARVALGGVAHRPWRAARAESVLAGAPATRAVFERAADAELADARPGGDNAFKIPLARRTLVRALADLAADPGAPRS